MGWLWVKLLSGQDVRTIGSGRTGGTNAMRAAGRTAGVLTGLGDFAKGLAGVGLARLLLPEAQYAAWAQWGQALAGTAAVLGHNWSIYIGFKGGAGTGPNLGVAAALYPIGVLLLVPLVPILLVLTGYASVTSIVVSALIPLTFLGLTLTSGWPWAYVAYGVITLGLVLLALRPNIRRLLDGTERMVGPRARRRGPAP
jgi:glycerol-3-phosphate acyltransferase PlsY